MKNRIVIYDFDGTLFKSPTREEALVIYEKHCFDNAISFAGDFPFTGWWGRPESLEYPTLPKDINPGLFLSHVIDAYRNDEQDDVTEVILMTGRPVKLKNRVLEICESNKLFFNRTFFTGQKGTVGSNTGEIKINFIENDILNDHKIEFFEIWEDRPEHVELFCEKAKFWMIKFRSLKKITIHDVKTGKNSTLCS
jgi:hypothetical protein